MFSRVVNVNLRELLVKECRAIAERERNPYCLQNRGNLHHICEWKIAQDFGTHVRTGNLDEIEGFYNKHIKLYGRYIKETSALRELNLFYDRDWQCLTCLDKFGDNVHRQILKEVYYTAGIPSQEVKDWFLRREV